MFRFIMNFIIIIYIFMFFNNSFAQYNPSKGVLVYFTEGIHRTALGEKSVNIESAKILNLFKKLNMDLKNIVPAFPDFNEADTVKILKNGTSVKLTNWSKIFKINVPDVVSREELIDNLVKCDFVLFAEPDGYADVDLIPSDNKFSNQWSLHNTGQTSGTSDADIDAPEAWNIFTGSSSIKIGIIDNGVDRNHEDLSGKVSGSTTLYTSHGTHVGGIAAAKANNQVNGQYFGIAGVDWNAQIIAKAFSSSSGDAYKSQIIGEAVSAGAHVLNNSWKLIPIGRYSTTVRFAFADAYKLNRISVASSGNTGDDNNTYQYPAGFGQGIITVGATDHNDNIADFSTHHNYVDVSAPGVDILSCINGGGFASYGGTSMATPIVSGIASLLKGYNSNLYNDDIEQIIRISAEDKGTTGWDEYYGTGRVNARKALDYLRTPYVLHHKSASGGSEHSHTGYFLITFYGVPGIANGTYYVKRYDVRKTVNWSETLEDVHVWGRGVGVGTNGYSLTNPNFAMGWGEVISHNNSSATLRTYVYDVWERGTWRHVGWKPTSPSNVSFNYTVFGEEAPVDPLSVTISGPSYLPFKASGICTANVSGGTSPISYQWYKKIDQGSWMSLGTYSTQQITMGVDDITMKVVVTDNYGLTDEDTHLIDTGIFKLAAGEEATLSIPDNHTVAQNYPNPFNPETQIRFGLPEDSKVTIEVFNLQGQKVATLANGYYEAGYHLVTFRGANHPSGVYFYRTVAGEFHDIKRMLLIK